LPFGLPVLGTSGLAAEKRWVLKYISHIFEARDMKNPSAGILVYRGVLPQPLVGLEGLILERF
jgi:hypothetical protein